MDSGVKRRMEGRRGLPDREVDHGRRAWSSLPMTTCLPHVFSLPREVVAAGEFYYASGAASSGE